MREDEPSTARSGRDDAMLRQGILRSIKHQPLSRAQLHELLHESEDRIGAMLATLRKAGIVRCIGSAMHRSWVLDDYVGPVPARRNRFLDQAGGPPAPQRASWWTGAPRDGFTTTAEQEHARRAARAGDGVETVDG